MQLLTAGGAIAGLPPGLLAKGQSPAGRVTVDRIRSGEDLFTYVRRQRGQFDAALYRQILGAANPFKEGDEIVGVAAADDQSRQNARSLIAATRVGDLAAHPVHEDDLHRFITAGFNDRDDQSSNLTLGELQEFVLTQSEDDVKSAAAGLTSDVIGCLVKLMTNEELIAVGARLFHSLPDSNIGGEGYLSARIQPNSPTDNLDDIRWQVFSGWSYAVGDALLGTNPVSSDPASVAAVEGTLQDLLVTFGIDNVLPHCVLAHIDVQAEVERTFPDRTALWFQSIAGTDGANQTFDISIEKMRDYAAQRTGKFGLYFETGQGADFTNGHAHGFDMVLHESRKYGFARALTKIVADAQRNAGRVPAPWVHLNDVAGFIGPEVFRTREQLVRCCLEDIVMGKLHGLTIGLDVCSTLHMDVSLADLDWCLDRIMPACPAYLMALPTKIDPMLGYLTTGYQDHVRLREKFALRADDRVTAFFRELGILDDQDRPTEHFGDPLWVYLQYRRRKGDSRTDADIRNEGRRRMEEVRGRGVFLAEGYGRQYGDLEESLAAKIQHIYEDSKESIWAELTPAFMATIPDQVSLTTLSIDRNDYILHPQSGEQLSDSAIETVHRVRREQAGEFDVQIVISDGLNALAISDEGHLDVFLSKVRDALNQAGYRPAPQHFVVTSGRVRAGYRIGELLFGGLPGPRAILHVIGERPGAGHHTFSVYITAPDGAVWNEAGQVDHNITRVVSGIAVTALAPEQGAAETVRVLKAMTN